MKQVHLFQLILHFRFSVRDGREKSVLDNFFVFLDNWPRKQKARSARRTGYQSDFLSLSNAYKDRLKMPWEQAQGEGAQNGAAL